MFLIVPLPESPLGFLGIHQKLETMSSNKRMEDLLERIFKPICEESKNFTEAFNRARNLRGLPEGLADYFYKSYGQNGFFSMKRAFYLLYVKLDGNSYHEKFPVEK